MLQIFIYSAPTIQKSWIRHWFGITASHHDFDKAKKHMFAIAMEYSITTCLTEAAIPSLYKISVICSVGCKKVFSHLQTEQAKTGAFCKITVTHPYSGKPTVIASKC